MNEESRFPFDQPDDHYDLKTGFGALWSNIDKSVNKSLPWVVMIAIVSCSLSGIAIGLSIGARDNGMLAERETRIMQDDLKFIRAYLSARGIDIPANHEEAEEK